MTTNYAAATGNAIDVFNYSTTAATAGVKATTSNVGTAIQAVTTSTGYSIKATDGTNTIFAVDGDSVVFPQLAGGDMYLRLSPFHKLDTVNIDPASEMLIMELPNLGEYLSDIQNGEIRWFQYNKSTKKIESFYGLSGKGPAARAHIYQGALELGYRWTYEAYKQIEIERNKRLELEKKVDNLEDRLVILEKVLSEHLDIE